MLVSFQDDLSFRQTQKAGPLLKKNSLKNNTNIKNIQKCSAHYSDKKDIIDKFFETKLGKVLKKIYCFGVDVDELLNL